MSDAQVYLDGRPLSTIAPWGELEYSDRFDGGCWEASWQMEVKPGFSHPLVRRGTRVEIREGGFPVWSGILTEPDRDQWKMTAQGLSREGEKYAALESDGTPGKSITTSTPVAITRGLPWVPATISPSLPAHADPVINGDSDGLNTISQLWTAVAEAAGRHWGVGPDGRPYMLPRPTTPRWCVAPGLVELGLADDEFATHLNGRYLNLSLNRAVTTRGDNGSPGTPSHRWGRKEADVDLTPRGPMTQATANAILDGMLTKVPPRPAYTNAIELGEHELTTMGGTRAHPASVRSGQVVRLYGVRDGALPYHDIVIGEFRRQTNERTLYIEPLGLAARNLAAVIEGDAKGLVA